MSGLESWLSFRVRERDRRVKTGKGRGGEGMLLYVLVQYITTVTLKSRYFILPRTPYSV